MKKKIIILMLVLMIGCDTKICPNTEIEIDSTTEGKILIEEFKENNPDYLIRDCINYCNKQYWYGDVIKIKNCWTNEACLKICKD